MWLMTFYYPSLGLFSSSPKSTLGGDKTTKMRNERTRIRKTSESYIATLLVYVNVFEKPFKYLAYEYIRKYNADADAVLRRRTTLWSLRDRASHCARISENQCSVARNDIATSRRRAVDSSSSASRGARYKNAMQRNG